MIADSQIQQIPNFRALGQGSQASSSSRSTSAGTRLVVRKIRRHRVRGRETQPHQVSHSPPISSQTQSRFLLTKASVAFAQSESTSQSARPGIESCTGQFKKAANGYAELLYKHLLYNKNDTSTDYSLGQARRLAQATREGAISSSTPQC